MIDRECQITIHFSILALPCICTKDFDTGWYKLLIADNNPELPLQFGNYEHIYFTGSINLIWPRIGYVGSNIFESFVPLIKGDSVTYIQFINGLSRTYSAYENIEYKDYTICYKSIPELLQEKTNVQLMEDSIFHFKEKNYAAKLIQKQWKITISDPSYKICQKRIYNKFSYLNNL